MYENITITSWRDVATRSTIITVTCTIDDEEYEGELVISDREMIYLSMT